MGEGILVDDGVVEENRILVKSTGGIVVVGGWVDKVETSRILEVSSSARPALPI